MFASRRARHELASASLAARDDAEVARSLRQAGPHRVGAGGATAVVDVDGVPVFAKRIPITDRELGHPHSTADLVGLPHACHYGMHRLAGPGFGAWRELAANTIVTEAMLGGDGEGFALLHHWRVLPGRPPIADEHLDLDAVLAQFGGDPAVRVRLQELAAARSSLVLFLEYLPHAVPDLLEGWVDRAADVERQLFDAVAFLRRHQILHLDGHFANMRADGDGRLHLVDFGLATSARFALSDAERGFVTRNADHDADYTAMRLVNWLVTDACGVAPATSGEAAAARNAYVRRLASGHLPDDVPPAVAGILARRAPAAAAMNDFCSRLYAGETRDEYRRP